MGAVPAAAHNSLTGSTPADGATLGTAPRTVRLTFLAALDPAATTVTVTGPDGATATAGRPTVRGKQVSVALRPGAAGGYTVAYAVRSTDGHPVKGTVRFTLTAAAVPAGGPVPTPPMSTPPAVRPSPTPTASAAAVASAGPSPVSGAADEDDEEDGGWWPWALGAVLPLALIAVGVALNRRRRA